MIAYIKSYSLIAPGFDNETKRWLVDETQTDNPFLQSNNPDYKQYFNPMALRRFSRILKNGSFAAKQALLTANVEIPDAIIIGTGLGCFEDTVNFLDLMADSIGGQLNPTPFMQSTHNSISALIALQSKCHGYNITYSHRSLSFENAISDAIMLLDEKQDLNILIGAADEMNDVLYRSLNESYDLPNGLRWGEVCSMFVLTNCYTEDCLCRISGLSYSDALSPLHTRITNFLEERNLSTNDIDLLLTAEDISNCEVDQIPVFNWKEASGECMTSISVPFAMAAEIFRCKTLPDIMLTSIANHDNIRNILIFNKYLNSSDSLILLSAC